MPTDSSAYATALAAAQAASAAERSRPLRSRRGDDPAVSVVMAVHGCEGSVLIDDRWEAVTAAGRAAARRAGSPS
jgi:hypothetical protein